MLKTKSIDILRTLNKSEFLRFEEFVESPYFNKNKSIVRLVNELKKFHPEFDSEILSEEYLYKKVYGKDIYNYSVMRNLMSGMLQLSEYFLLNNRLNKDIFKNPGNILDLLDEFQTRNIDNLFKLRLKNIEKTMLKEKYDNVYFKNKVNILNFILDDEYNKVSFKSTLKDIFFKKAMLELCSIANSLYRNANSIYYSSIDNNVNADDSYFFIFLKCIDISKFLKELEKSRLSESRVIEIYFKLVNLILNPQNTDNFFDVRNLIFKNINHFSNKEKYSLLNILRNFVLFELARGVKIFESENISINLKMLETINFGEDKMESILGIIYLGIFLEYMGRKEYKSAEDFINKYSGQLRKEIRKDINGYASAYIQLVKGNFESSLELLSHIKPPNKVYFIQIKLLYMKIYYELGYINEGLSVIDSFRHFLDNNADLNPDKKKLFIKTCRHYFRLYKLRLNPEKVIDYDVVKLINELNEDKLNIDTRWILSKAEEIKKLYK